MSSPDLNCFFAAARTASFIASITRSRSIPCSWQSASMFCAIDELMELSLSHCLGYRLQGNLHSPIGTIFKQDGFTIQTQQAAAKIALTLNQLTRLHFCQASGKTLVIRTLVESSFDSRRRHFQSVGRVNEVFYVENRAEMKTHCRAIFVSNTLRLINEDTHNGLIVRAGNFRVYQFDSVVDCDLFSQCLNPFCNRNRTHCQPPRHLSPKIKSGREPTGRDPVLRASRELYGKVSGEASCPTLRQLRG